MSDQTGDQPAADSGNKHSHRKAPSKKRSREKIIGGKVLAWAAGVAGTTIAAFVTAYVTTLGTTTAAAHTGASLTVGEPVLVTLGDVASDDESFALPKAEILSNHEIEYLSAARDNPASSGFTDWFAAQHAAFVGKVNIQLVVQGNRHQLVRVIDITPVESCSAPLHGTMFFMPAQGENPSARLFLDLDNPLQPASYSPAASVKRYPDYFGQYSVSLGFGEQFTFQVTASTNRQYCAFKLDLTVVDDGKTVIETVDDRGQPFRLTSLPAEPDGRIRFTNYQVLYLNIISAENDNVEPDTFNFTAYPWIRGNPKTYVW